MGDKTKIEWAEASWNPVTGCTKVSLGCKNCYAERIAKRFNGNFDVRVHPDRLHQPCHWKNPRRIFVCSMGDLFHEDIPERYIDCIFNIMYRLHRHTFIILTKRPDRLLGYIRKVIIDREDDPTHTNIRWQDSTSWKDIPIPLDNAWIGITAENQQTADERIPILFQIPAKVRFISAEPLLEKVYLGLTSMWAERLDWVICGGETGPKARPMNLDWARSLRDQCQESNTPFFFKKQGNNKSRLLDGKEWSEYPLQSESVTPANRLYSANEVNWARMD